MKYESIDELSTFEFTDAQIVSADRSGDFVLLVDALIVTPKNSQNSEYNSSYADTAELRFRGSSIISAVKEGYKRYDANDCLLEEVPDTVLTTEETDALLRELEGVYLYDVQQLPDVAGTSEYVLGLDTSDGTPQGELFASEYQIRISCCSAVVSWERYMNRIQNF